MRYVFGLLVIVALVYNYVYHFNSWNSFIIAQYYKVERKLNFFQPLPEIASAQVNLDIDDTQEKVVLASSSRDLYLSFFNNQSSQSPKEMIEEYRIKMKIPRSVEIKRLEVKKFSSNQYLLDLSYRDGNKDYLGFAVFTYNHRPILALNRLHNSYPSGEIKYDPGKWLSVTYKFQEDLKYVTLEQYDYQNNKFILKIKETVPE